MLIVAVSPIAVMVVTVVTVVTVVINYFLNLSHFIQMPAVSQQVLPILK